MNLKRLFLTQLKQFIKEPESFLLLLSLPILTILLSGIGKAQEQAIRVVCYLPGISVSDTSEQLLTTDTDSAPDASLSTLAEKLYRYDGLYFFDICTSEQEVFDAVAGNRAECGYLFPTNLYAELLKGNLRELVTTVASPSTTMLPVINETVYSLIFEGLAIDALNQYLSEDSSIAAEYDTLYDKNDVEELYQKYLLDDSAFHFEYSGNPEEYRFIKASVLLSPIRGILSVLVLLSAFTGAISFYHLAETSVFNTWKMRISSVTVPVLYTMPVMLICIYFAGLGTGLVKEFLCILFYGAACILFTLLLTIIIKKRVIFVSLLPLFILACLIFTPVFIDISVFLPAMKPLSYLFLPYYYLILF